MKKRLHDITALVMICAASLFLAVAMAGRHFPGDDISSASRLERRISKRMDLLEKYVARDAGTLPEDMVIYRYVNDSLLSWVNRFSVNSDDISSRVFVERLSNMRMNPRSPLADLDDTLRFCNFGPTWYLARRVDDGRSTIIYGLEVMRQSFTNTFNGVNPRLRVSDSFSIRPLSTTGGSPVSIGGIPQFKLIYDSNDGDVVFTHAVLVWLAYLLLLLSAFLFVAGRRSVRRFLIASGTFVVVNVMMYLWGLNGGSQLPVFSPSLYAGGGFLFSLGAVILVNLALATIAALFFMVRRDFRERLSTPRSGLVFRIAAVLVAVVLLVYLHLTLRSIILNSGIVLELYKIPLLSFWSAVVYFSCAGVLIGVVLLLNVAGFDSLSNAWRAAESVLIGVWLVVLAATLGFSKEEKRIDVWANRLAVDRDITMEMTLRRVEGQIANDLFISTLAFYDNAASTIQNRISDIYLPRLSSAYNISVFLFNDVSESREKAAFLSRRMREGDPISDDSRFLFADTDAGRPRYDGIFLYVNERGEVSHMVVEIERKAGLGEKGYSSLMGETVPGRVSLPGRYAYARYKGQDIIAYRGSYAYRTTIVRSFSDKIYEERSLHYDTGGWTHFATAVSDDGIVIISRPSYGVFNFILAAALIAIIFFALLAPIAFFSAGKTKQPGRSYFRSRISSVLLISLILTLVALAMVSVIFVYRRNDANKQSIMSGRVGAIQNMVQNGIGGALTTADLLTPSTVAILETAGKNTDTDITLYAPDGRLMMSTSPLVSDVLIGSRMDGDAYNAVAKESRRFFIHKEKLGRREFYCMYAPVMNAGGKMIAIICSPYTGGETYEFERDAIVHSVAVIVMFILLLLLARYVITGVVDKMFGPLGEMGRKMSTAGLDSLEPIRYDREDEVSLLVDAYNRMVERVSENSRTLAQAERDKAWSGMARQVAHEIKNPLTPMKLQLQRILRLKQKGDPQWEEKFDGIAKVILDHIDILTETANGFSDLARLYTEESTEIDIDKVLQEEISMFDSRSGVTFDYMGLKGAIVSGPKPQLTRVFVNLITNSVQAVSETPAARVLVSLRNSSDNGYFDIVVEDNGPGVAEENVDKLFSPNFTTKNGGSGLGLAISRSILERCGATVSYSRSFVLGGACFTVKYPKNSVYLHQ